MLLFYQCLGDTVLAGRVMIIPTGPVLTQVDFQRWKTLKTNGPKPDVYIKNKSSFLAFGLGKVSPFWEGSGREAGCCNFLGVVKASMNTEL